MRFNLCCIYDIYIYISHKAVSLKRKRKIRIWLRELLRLIVKFTKYEPDMYDTIIHAFLPLIRNQALRNPVSNDGTSGQYHNNLIFIMILLFCIFSVYRSYRIYLTFVFILKYMLYKFSFHPFEIIISNFLLKI